MNKITIKNYQFKCPMMGITIKERGEINFGICRLCKYNILGQFINDTIYCGYGSSSGSVTPDPGNEESDQPYINDDDDVWEDYTNDNG